jgi:putative hydrolase of the HAD superfamily
MERFAMAHGDHIGVVLFDLGGVLVELSGVSSMLGWMENRISREELLRMWLASPVVRAFETGQVASELFADQLIVEMNLPVGRDELLDEFTRWPTGLFPGALELIGRVPRRYTRATLSNTNALHWPRLMQEMQLAGVFDHYFASHLIGKIKPDEEVFHHVTQELGCKAGEILFLDDSPLNVAAAKRVGINAVQTRGIAEAERILLDNGVIENGGSR